MVLVIIILTMILKRYYEWKGINPIQCLYQKELWSLKTKDERKEANVNMDKLLNNGKALNDKVLNELLIKREKVNTEDFRKTLVIMGDIFAEKNKKYGGSFEVSLDKYGMIAALTRISDKFNRMENLILTNDEGTSDESIMDTLIDMANYCVMTAVYMKNSEREEYET